MQETMAFQWLSFQTFQGASWTLLDIIFTNCKDNFLGHDSPVIITVNTVLSDTNTLSGHLVESRPALRILYRTCFKQSVTFAIPKGDHLELIQILLYYGINCYYHC